MYYPLPEGSRKCSRKKHHHTGMAGLPMEKNWFTSRIVRVMLSIFIKSESMEVPKQSLPMAKLFFPTDRSIRPTETSSTTAQAQQALCKSGACDPMDQEKNKLHSINLIT